MARVFVASKQQTLLYEGVLPSITYPFTITGWFNPGANTGNSQTLVNIQDLSYTNSMFYGCEVNSSGNFRSYAKAPSLSWEYCTTTNALTFSDGNWYFLTAVFESSTSRKVYLNGTGEGTSSLSSPLTGITFDALRIGSIKRGSADPSPFFWANSKIGYVAIYNVVFTAADALEVYTNSYDPTVVNGANLLMYWSLNDNTDPEVDSINTISLSLLPSLDKPTFESGPSLSSGGGSIVYLDTTSDSEISVIGQITKVYDFSSSILSLFATSGNVVKNTGLEANINVDFSVLAEQTKVSYISSNVNVGFSVLPNLTKSQLLSSSVISYFDDNSTLNLALLMASNVDVIFTVTGTFADISEIGKSSVVFKTKNSVTGIFKKKVNTNVSF